MSRIMMYTRQDCPFSEQARLFLEEKGIPYEEVDITGSPELQAEMEASGGTSSTPQIFLDGELLGGFDDLLEEDRQGRLAATMASGLETPGDSRS
jgi:glutaredoxin 3